MDNEDKMFLVTNSDCNNFCTILTVCKTLEDAITYLTKHINFEFKPSESNNYRISQKTDKMFEVYKVGYFGKYFHSKYQVIEVTKP